MFLEKKRSIIAYKGTVVLNFNNKSKKNHENLQEEIWRDIEGYEGLYQVSNMGRVKSLDRITNDGKSLKGKLKNGTINEKLGYVLCCLYKNNIPTLEYIHRLVAEAFPEICGETFEGWQVDHINTIKEDNRASNLRVCTARENSNNPLSKGKISGENSYMFGKHHSEGTKRKMSETHKGKGKKPIIQFSLKGEFIKLWGGSIEAADSLGLNRAAISKCLRGKSKTSGGFKWEYA